MPGFVCATDDKQAYVFIDGLPTFRPPGTAGPDHSAAEAKVAVIVDPGRASRTIPAELLADYSNNFGGYGGLVAAPAGGLPAPPTCNPKPHLTEPMPVTIAGLEFVFDQATRSAACKLVHKEARVAEIRRTARLEVVSYVLDGKELDRVRLGAVVSPWGDLLGLFRGQMIRTGFDNEIVVTPLPSYDWLQKPQIGTIAFLYKTKEGEDVGYTFVVGVTDPFQHVHAPRLLVKKFEPFAANRSAQGVDARGALEGATEVTLAKDDGPTDIDAALRARIAATKAAIWAGPYDVAPSGSTQNETFTVQFAYNRDDGTTEYLPPRQVLVHSEHAATPADGPDPPPSLACRLSPARKAPRRRLADHIGGDASQCNRAAGDSISSTGRGNQVAEGENKRLG